MKIIKAKEIHFLGILNIYNWAISETTSTFDTELKTIESFSEFLKSFHKHPLLVAVKNDEVLGWGCLKRYSDRCAYNDTVELSIYIDPNHHGKGIGKFIMEELIKSAQENKFHTILSRITAESEASIALHKKFGFFEIGVMKEVGFKFNRRIDVIIMQKLFQE